MVKFVTSLKKCSSNKLEKEFSAPGIAIAHSSR
jgi:hypothetical protein